MARINAITVISGILMLGGLLSAAYFSVLLEHTFVGKKGNVNLDEGQNYSVFLTESDSNSEAPEHCSGVNVTVNDGNGDQFKVACQNRDDKIYLGYVQPNSTGEFTVSSSHDITLEKYPTIETREFAFTMFSEGVCFLGLVGVIIGVRSGK